MRRLLIPLCSAIALSACTQTTSTSAESLVASPKAKAAFYPRSQRTTRVNGFVWDPEAYNWSFNFDQQSGSPPLLDLHSGHLLRSLVTGASVSVLAETGQSQIATTTGITGPYGDFVVDAPSSDSLYLMKATASAGSLGEPPPTDPNVPPFAPIDPPLPAGQYLPTVLLRRVTTHPTYCYVPAVPVASDTGILQAVAKFYTNALGIPTTVSDFLDPNKFGGVVIWYKSPGAGWNVFLTAQQTGTTSDVGDTVDIAWDFPGDPALPPDALAIQSDRGYLASPDPSFNIGVSVTLLPPSSGPTTVTLSSQDFDMTDPGHPVTFSNATYSVYPGVISYGYEMQDLGPDRLAMGPNGLQPVPLPDPWRCIPDLNQDL